MAFILCETDKNIPDGHPEKFRECPEKIWGYPEFSCRFHNKCETDKKILPTGKSRVPASFKYKFKFIS